MTDNKQKICVVGLGYIGLPTASLLATKGFTVQGVDVSQHVVDTINAGNIHIREPELDVLVRSAVQSGHLKASLEPAPADVFILAVPTPFKDGHVPDLDYVEAASRSIAPTLRPDNLVILESTSPVGTTEQVASWILEERPDLAGVEATGNTKPHLAVRIAHCPERVLPGQIIKELVDNDRIVGGVDEPSTEVAASFYSLFVTGEILITDSRTAELAKLTENTYRDVNIAFANELAIVCESCGIDPWRLIQLANHHPRVNILQPGPGVGGHCIAVDPWFIISAHPEQTRLIRAGRDVNSARPAQVVEHVRQVAARLKDPVIACFGLAYKADIDDLRESPALEITQKIAQLGLGRTLAVEPNIDVLPASVEEAGATLIDLESALAQADIIVGLVDHRPFKTLPRSALQEKIVIDTRGMWR